MIACSRAEPCHTTNTAIKLLHKLLLHHKCAFICLMQHRGGINVFTVAENVQKLTAAKTKCVKVVVTSET